MAITQAPLRLGVAIFAADGVTKVYGKIESLESGLSFPPFPDVGHEAQFEIGTKTYHTTITRKTFTYFADDVLTHISTLMTIAAQERS